MSLISRAWRSSTPGLPTLFSPILGICDLPRKISGKLVGKRDRLDARQFGREPAHEARAIVARSADGLAEFDRVLGLEMAAGQVVAECPQTARTRSRAWPTTDRCCRATPDAAPSPRQATTPHSDCRRRAWRCQASAASCDRSRSKRAPRHWRRHRRRAETPPAAAHRWPAPPRRGQPTVIGTSAAKALISSRRFMVRSLSSR